MLEGLPPELLQYGGPAALLGVVFLMVMRGYLVPVREVERLERERDDWRELARELAVQNHQLMGIGGKAVDALDAIPVPKDR